MYTYVAEQLVGEKCTEKADIYSLGIVLWELCTLDSPMLRQTRDIMYAIPQPHPSVTSAIGQQLHGQLVYLASHAFFPFAGCACSAKL